MTDSTDISKKVYEAEDIQKLLGLEAGTVPCHQDWEII